MSDGKVAGEGKLTSEDEQRRQESLKLLYDLFKHLTTLSTGSILIVPTLVRTLFPNPELKVAFAASIVFLAVSLDATMVAMVAVILDVRKPYTGDGLPESSERRTSMRLFFMAWGYFLVGIGAFLLFALKNVY